MEIKEFSEHKDKEEWPEVAMQRLASVAIDSLNGFSDDSLTIYLADIRNIPLISRDEEVMLANQIQAGDFVASQQLIEANLRLVIDIAKRYQDQGIDLHDLIGAGNTGLVIAAGKYDPHHESGAKFSTLATWWIRAAITQTIKEHRSTIRLSDSMNNSIFAMVRASNRLKQELGRDLSDEDDERLTAELGIIPEKLAKIKQAKWRQHPASFDAQIGEGGETIGDSLEDEGATDLGDVITRDELNLSIYRLLKTLPKTERDYLQMRFGLNMSMPHTQKQIAQIYNIPPKHVSLMEKEILDKLRDDENIGDMRVYLE